MSDVQILDITNEEYHARPEWSSSQVKLLPDDPWLFYRRHIEKHPDFQFQQTESIQIGTDVHEMVLEDKPVVMIPQEVLQRRKNRWSDTEYTYAKAGDPWKEFKAAHPGAVLCKQGDPRLHMADSLRNEPVARKWLDAEGPVEKSIVYRDEVTGLDLRARLDKLAATPGASVVFDIKSTVEDPFDRRAIAKVIYNLGYHRQGTWYWDAVDHWCYDDVAAVVLGFVQNKPPYGCHCWELSADSLTLGRQQNLTAKRMLAERLDKGEWKPEGFGVTSIADPPEWAPTQENGHDE